MAMKLSSIGAFFLAAFLASAAVDAAESNPPPQRARATQEIGLYAGPSLHHRQLRTVPTGAEVEVLDWGAVWWEVQFDGVFGFAEWHAWEPLTKELSRALSATSQGPAGGDDEFDTPFFRSVEGTPAVEAEGEIGANGDAASPAGPQESADKPGSAADPPPPAVDRPVADRLLAVTLETQTQHVAVRLKGAGSFDYSWFSLSDPERIVIDLAGVLVDPDLATGSASEPVVATRVGQFARNPQPICRVVLDLDRAVEPTFREQADGLLVLIPHR